MLVTTRQQAIMTDKQHDISDITLKTITSYIKDGYVFENIRMNGELIEFRLYKETQTQTPENSNERGHRKDNIPHYGNFEKIEVIDDITELKMLLSQQEGKFKYGK